MCCTCLAVRCSVLQRVAACCCTLHLAVVLAVEGAGAIRLAALKALGLILHVRMLLRTLQTRKPIHKVVTNSNMLHIYQHTRPHMIGPITGLRSPCFSASCSGRGSSSLIHRFVTHSNTLRISTYPHTHDSVYTSQSFNLRTLSGRSSS